MSEAAFRLFEAEEEEEKEGGGGRVFVFFGNTTHPILSCLALVFCSSLLGTISRKKSSDVLGRNKLFSGG